MHSIQRRCSRRLSSKRVSMFKGLRDAREEHLKELFFGELIKAFEDHFNETEK